MKSLFCIALFLSFFTFGNAQQFNIKKIDIGNGISSNYIVSVTQDKRGFLWFASESGLNRFDGHRFKIYKKSSASQSSISGNELNKVYADKYDDIIWIATQRNGLNMFDYQTETFTHYRFESTNSKGIITDDITDIINAKDGNIWLSTYHRGIEHFDKKTETFTHYNRSTIPAMVSDNVWSVNEDSKGFLYIGHVTKGLSILSLKDKQIKNFRHNPNNPQSLPGDEVRTIYVDKNDNVWVGTNNGLALFNAEKESFIVFRHDPNNSQSLISNFIYAINQLQDGKLWIGTEMGGVSILDIQQSMFLSPQQVPLLNISYSDDTRGFSNSTIRSIFQDSFNNIWFGTYGGGVNFISHQSPLFNTWIYSPRTELNNSLNNNTAWGICADKDNRIWVGTDGGGINLFENGQREQVLDTKTSHITDNSVLAATKDSDNNLWFGTFRGGIHIYDSHQKSLSKLDVDDKVVDIRCFYEDENKNMWIGSNAGLYQYNSRTRIGKLYSTSNSDLPNNLVRAISKDDKGQLWIGFFGEGLAIMDKDMKKIKTFKTDKGFPSNTIDHMLKDTKNRMWIATGEGLAVFDSAANGNENFTVFNKKNGYKDTHVRAIAEDDTGNIWISSNDGISRLVPDQKRFYNYDNHNGVPLGEFMSGSVTKDTKGIIYFGSQNGLCYFDPKRAPTIIELPPTVITEFKIYGNQLNLPDTDVPVRAAIELANNQNTFNVSFNVLDYSLNNQIEHAYMLTGMEDLWYNIQGENSITFRNVPPGKYELKIKSRIKNEEWSETYTSLYISINPPIWLTWWAKTSYAIILLISAFFLLGFYKRKLDLENSLTLEKKNHLQEQELNNERLRFFTNITHELRTPLTLILGPLEDLHSDPSLHEKHASRIAVIYRSATRLLDLINQILEFRKTETQNKKLCVAKNDISQLVHEVGLKYKELNTNKHITFSISIDTQNTILYFDPDIVTTVLENLVSNAFKYTQKATLISFCEIQKSKTPTIPK